LFIFGRDAFSWESWKSFSSKLNWFLIGGVAAFDVEKDVISPGGVGYDINCSVIFKKLVCSFVV